ncbi:hypothetical protein COLO4_27323 [Corchorus olitorius]|uniref:Sulfotransferase n=1 Tax=Corchorus olitorius TaxID=93759 RepID=A0A1R3HRP2_9ROSI|nr:hypothetical protein COLO4_27323 [Corchorus olitorius]
MGSSKTFDVTAIDVEKVEEGYRKTYEKLDEMLPTLAQGENWLADGVQVVQYQGFWLPKFIVQGIMLIHDHFNPRPTDIILSTFPKCGTTWLRALIFAIINRKNYYDFQNHPLLSSNPQDLVPFFEMLIHEGGSTSSIESLPSPRFLATHIPFPLIPKSMTSSSSGRFVYICREPKDVFVSMWHFMNKLRAKELAPLSLEEAFDFFCRGVTFAGSYWDHVLGFWEASLESPNKVLFLKYEDMKRDPSVYVRKLAEFLDLPFSAEEEDEGMVEKIVKLCSFESLSNLDVNKNGNNTPGKGKHPGTNSDFFRKGQIGDWRNHLTPQMVEVLDKITKEKFQGTELSFDLVSY